MRIHYYETPAGRRPAKDFIDELPTRQRAQVLADLEAVERYGLLAPVSKKAIRGRDNKGMYEFRIGPDRIYYTTWMPRRWSCWADRRKVIRSARYAPVLNG